jgi:glycosyltransferase involved in cell wall biosynthesis
VDNSPKKQYIVIDGAHFSKKGGTGIATYARTLASTLRQSRYSLAILHGQRIGGHKHLLDFALSTQVFGQRPRRRSIETAIETAVQSVRLLARAHLHGKPTAKAIEIATSGIDFRAADPQLPATDKVFNASDLYDRAGYAFDVKRRFTEVTFPERVALAHWTYPLPVKAKGALNVYTIHDLVPLQFPYFVFDKNGRAANIHATIARDADLIITVSEASKQAIVELLNVAPNRVAVTYQPTPSLPVVPKIEAERLVQNIYGVRPGDYVLFLGATEPKKNVKRLIEAFLFSGVRLPLVVAGPRGWLDDEEQELIKMITPNVNQKRDSSYAGTSVRRVGFLPRRHATALLQCARFFAFPSICEGFGLPVLEAMQLGVPVLTSNISSLPEVAGDAALLVDPLDVTDMASAIRTLSQDRSLREELARRGAVQAKKFNDDFYREKLAAAYKKVGITIPVGTTRDENDIAIRTPSILDMPVDHADGNGATAASSSN